MDRFYFKFKHKDDIKEMGVMANNYEEGLKKAKKWAKERDIEIKIIEEE